MKVSLMEAIEEKIKLLQVSRPGGRLLMSDFGPNASPELILKYKKDIVENPLMVDFGDEVRDGEELIKALVRSAAGLTGDAKITDNKFAVIAEQRAQVEFEITLLRNLSHYHLKRLIKKLLNTLKEDSHLVQKIPH